MIHRILEAIKEKEYCITQIQSKFDEKESELAQLNNLRIQQLLEQKEQLDNDHSMKVVKIEQEQDAQTRSHEIEMKGLQEKVKMLNENLDDSEKDFERKLEQQRQTSENMYGGAIDALKNENKKVKKENERVLRQQAQKQRQELEDLDDKMKKILTNERETHKLKIKELDFEREKEKEELTKKLDELKKELEDLSRDSTQKLKEKELENLTKMANLEKDLTLKMEEEKNRKLKGMQDEYEMKLERKKQENDFQVRNLEFQLESGQDRLRRTIDRNHDLGIREKNKIIKTFS